MEFIEIDRKESPISFGELTRMRVQARSARTAAVIRWRAFMWQARTAKTPAERASALLDAAMARREVASFGSDHERIVEAIRSTPYRRPGVRNFYPRLGAYASAHYG